MMRGVLVSITKNQLGLCKKLSHIHSMYYMTCPKLRTDGIVNGGFWREDWLVDPDIRPCSGLAKIVRPCRGLTHILGHGGG